MTFWRKKPKYHTITTMAQVKGYIREFILDSQVPNAHDISINLGCAPLSAELEEREDEESDKRVERVDHLIPLLYGYSALFSEAFTTNFTDQFEGHDVSPEAAKAFTALTNATRKMMEEIMAHLLMGAVSQLVDLELLKVNRKRHR